MLNEGTLRLYSRKVDVGVSDSEGVPRAVPGPVLTNEPGKGDEMGPIGDTAIGVPVPFSDVDGQPFGIDVELRLVFIRFDDFVLSVPNERLMNVGRVDFGLRLSFSSIAFLKLLSLSSEDADVDGVGSGGDLDLCSGRVRIGEERFMSSAMCKSLTWPCIRVISYLHLQTHLSKHSRLTCLSQAQRLVARIAYA